MHKSAVCAVLAVMLAAPVGQALAQQPTPTPPDTTRQPSDTSQRAGPDTTNRVVPPNEQRDTAVRTVRLEETEQQAPTSILGRFSITPVVGTIFWDDASALSNKKPNDAGVYDSRALTPSLGLSAEYNVLEQLGLGFYFEAARTETRGDYFPALIFNTPGLPAELRQVSQRVTTMVYGLQGTFRFPFERFEPYAGAGFGWVTVTLDPQQNTSNSAFTNSQFQFGGGVGYRVGPTTAIRFDVRDYVFRDWDRDQLYPVSPAYQNTAVPSVNFNPPAEKSTIHNWRIALGFTYTPRGTAGPAAGTNPADEQE